mgnify:CR=1 FL=1
MIKLIAQDERYCVVSPTGGPLTICVTANNGLRAGAVFWLWAKDENDKWVKKGKFDLKTGDSGRGCKELEFPVNSLERNALTWRITTCSFIPAVDAGNIEVQIIQDNVSCQVTRPMQWSLSEVGQCSQDSGKQIESAVHILFK